MTCAPNQARIYPGGPCPVVLLSLLLPVAVLMSVSAAAAGPEDSTYADTPDQYKVFVADQYSYDDNVFRLPTYFPFIGNGLAPNASREDHFDTVSVGTDDHWGFARQSLSLMLELSENFFVRNTDLDNTSGIGNFLWTWQFSSSLSGHAGVDYVRQLANSSQTLYYGKDLVSSITEYADARYALGPHWTVFGGLRNAEITNSAVEVQVNDYRNQTANGGLEYATSANDTIGAEYRYTTARAPQNLFYAGLDVSDYSEQSARITLKYLPTDKTSIDAYVGYLQREYPDTTAGEFSGDIWRVNFNWQPTDKTRLVASVWRDLQAYVDAESNYFVAKGESLMPTWAASEKINVSATFSWVTQDYIASSPAFITLGTRRDTVNSQIISLLYFPERSVTLTFSYDNESHNSNISEFVYSDRLMSAAVKVAF